jgi:hypothetical protein
MSISLEMVNKVFFFGGGGVPFLMKIKLETLF